MSEEDVLIGDNLKLWERKYLYYACMQEQSVWESYHQQNHCYGKAMCTGVKYVDKMFLWGRFDFFSNLDTFQRYSKGNTKILNHFKVIMVFT